MPAPSPSPRLTEIPPDLEQDLLAAYFDPDVTFSHLAKDFNLTITAVAEWSERKDVQEKLAKVRSLNQRRARDLCAERAVQAAHTLDQVQALLFSSEMSGCRPSTKAALAESARRAATTLLKYAGSPKVEDEPDADEKPPAHTRPAPPSPGGTDVPSVPGRPQAPEPSPNPQPQKNPPPPHPSPRTGETPVPPAPPHTSPQKTPARAGGSSA